MLEKIDAVLDAENIKNGMSGNDRQFEISAYYTTNAANIQVCALCAYLLIGRENAQTAQELADRIGISSPRVITREIAKLRNAGVPVCASCHKDRPGYFLPETKEELDGYLLSLKNRCRQISAVYESMTRTQDELTGQARMEGY